MLRIGKRAFRRYFTSKFLIFIVTVQENNMCDNSYCIVQI